MNSSSLNNSSLNTFLLELGFDEWLTFTATLLLPTFNLLGITLGSINVWIFFCCKEFRLDSSVHVYYRLLAVLFLFHSLLNLPLCICYAPMTYFGPHATSIFLITNIICSSFLFHYEETIQIAILLSRMKLFSHTIRKYICYFTPLLVSIFLCLICMIIHVSAIFLIKVDTLSVLSLQSQTRTLYYLGKSDFSHTQLGHTLTVFNQVFNLIFSLIASLTLNVISYVKFKRYIKEKRERVEQTRVQSIAEACSSLEATKALRVNQRELREAKDETNKFYMAFTFCVISLIMRVLIILGGNLFWFYDLSFSSMLSLMLAFYFVSTFTATISFFIFYAFSKRFRACFISMMENGKMFVLRKILRINVKFKEKYQAPSSRLLNSVQQQNMQHQETTL